MLRRSTTLQLTWRSLELAAVVTAACLVLGVGLAWLVSRTDIAGRAVWQTALALPLALPSYVAAWSWIGWWPDVAGRGGAIVVLVSISYPYVYLPALAALRRCDPAIDDVAHTLGRRGLPLFLRVTLPQIRTSVIGGGLLVGLYVLSDFGAVATMRYPVLTHAIYRSYRASFDRTPAAVMGCILALLAIAIVVAEARVNRRRDAAKVGSGALRPQPVVRLGRARWVAPIVPIAVLSVSLGIPSWGLRIWMSQGDASPEWGRFLSAAANTLQVGAIGAVAVVALAFPVAILSVRYRGWTARVARVAAYAGHALPGVVVGLSLVFFGVRYARPIYQEMPLLVMAYVVLFLSLALGSLQGALSQIPPGLEDVARTLGNGPLRAWAKVTARLAAPGAGAAATLVFLTIMKELPATLFLRPTGFDTLATQLWSHTSSFTKSAAAPYAIAIVLLAALPTALLAALGDRRRETS